MGNSPSQSSGFHPPPQNAVPPARPPSGGGGGHQNATSGSLNSNNNRNISPSSEATMKNLSDTNYDPSSPRPNFSLSSLADRNFSWTPTSKASPLEQGPHSIDSLLVVDTNLASTRTGDFSPSSLSPDNNMQKRCPLPFQCQHSRDNSGIMVQSGYEVRDDNDVLTHFYDDSLELLPQPEDDIQTDSILIQEEKCHNVEEKVDNINNEAQSNFNLDHVIPKPENPSDQNEPTENAINISTTETILRGSPSSSGFISDLDPASLLTISAGLTQPEICPLNKIPSSSPSSTPPALVRDDENVAMIDELHRSQDSNRQDDVNSSAPIITQTLAPPPQLAKHPEVQQVQLQQVQQSKLRESEPETKLFLISSTSNEEDERNNNNASLNLINLDHDIIQGIHKEESNQEVVPVKDKYISVVQIMTDDTVTTTITHVDEAEEPDNDKHDTTNTPSPSPPPLKTLGTPDPTVFTEIDLDQDSDAEDFHQNQGRAIPIPPTTRTTKPPLLESESLHEFESLEELIKKEDQISSTDNNYVTRVPVNYTSLGLIIPCNPPPPPAEFQTTQPVETKEEEEIAPSSPHLNSDDNIKCSSSNSSLNTNTTTTTSISNKRKVQFASEMTSPSRNQYHHHSAAVAAVPTTAISPIRTSSRKQGTTNCHLLPKKNSKFVNKSPPCAKSENDMNFLGLFGNKELKKVFPETATPSSTPSAASLVSLSSSTTPTLPQGDDSPRISHERGDFNVVDNSWSGGTMISNTNSSLITSRSESSCNGSGDRGQDRFGEVPTPEEKTEESSRLFSESVCYGRDFAHIFSNHYPEEGCFMRFSPPPVEQHMTLRPSSNRRAVAPELDPASFANLDNEGWEEQRRLEEERKLEKKRKYEEQMELEEQKKLEEQRMLEEQRLEELRLEEFRKLQEQKRQEEINMLEEQRKLFAEKERRVVEQNMIEEQRKLDAERERKVAEQNMIEEQQKLFAERERRVAEHSRVLAEYEKTLGMYSEKIEDLKRELEQSDKDRCLLIKERDLAIEDLSNVESAFSDVHRKYERSKGILSNLKENENRLIAHEEELVQKIENRDKKLSLYKEKAQEKLEQMYQDYEHKIKDVESENTRLRAQCRLLDMKLATLENDVEQKAKENSQLNALCNELIAGQGASNNN